MNGYPPVAAVASSSASSSMLRPSTMIVVRSASRTSFSATSSSSSRLARRRNVRTSSLSRSETAAGRPATARATLRSSRTRCWNVAARSRSSSRACLWTSSTVMSRPVSSASSTSRSRPTCSRHSTTSAGRLETVTPPPITGRVTPVTDRPGAVEGSRSCRWRVTAWVSRSTRPGVAVSDTATQPSLRASFATSVSITVLPTPRAPVKIVSRPGAPGPSARESLNSSNLLCLSSRGGLAFRGSGGAVEVAVDLAGEVALEASTDLAEGAAFSGSALNVGAGGRVHAHAGDDGHVERAVEATVTAAVDAVSDGVAGRRRNWVHTGEAGERRFGSDAAQVRPRGQRHRGGDRADAGLFEQSASGALVDQVGDALGDLLEVVVERRHAFGQPDGLPSGGGGGEGLVSGAPSSDRGDLSGGKWAARVDAEVAHAQQRGQCIDRGRAFGAHVVTGGEQDADGRSDSIVCSWLAQLRLVQR